MQEKHYETHINLDYLPTICGADKNSFINNKCMKKPLYFLWRVRYPAHANDFLHT